jgi:hypothetical protein
MIASPRAMVPALLVLGLYGCQQPPASSEVAMQVIGPAGGIITSSDGVLTLAIPPGALEQQVELFIERTDEPPAVYGPAYLVRPSPELRYDLSVTYHHELPADSSGLAVAAVDALAYAQGSGGWVALPLLRVDRRAKLVSGLDDGVSIFYALLDDAPPPTATETGDTGAPTTGEPTTTDVPDETTGAPDETTGGSSGPGESTGAPQ